MTNVEIIMAPYNDYHNNLVKLILLIKQNKSRDDHENVLLNLVHSKKCVENIHPINYHQLN